MGSRAYATQEPRRSLFVERRGSWFLRTIFTDRSLALQQALKNLLGLSVSCFSNGTYCTFISILTTEHKYVETLSIFRLHLYKPFHRKDMRGLWVGALRRQQSPPLELEIPNVSRTISRMNFCNIDITA